MIRIKENIQFVALTGLNFDWILLLFLLIWVHANNGFGWV